VNSDRVLYWEFHEEGFNRAIRFGNWKAIQFGKDGAIELYDLKSDPGERTNLAAGKPDVIAAAKAHFAKARTDSADFPIQPGIARSPDRGARIR
jgi:arylsulfatase A-like enzyme